MASAIVVTKRWDFLLRTFTDTQLERLFQKILTKIQKRFSGGTSFGVDLPTLALCEPGLWYCYMAVKAEGSRRVKERKAA